MTTFHMLSNCTKHYFSLLEKQSLAQTTTTGDISLFLRNSGAFFQKQDSLHSLDALIFIFYKVQHL